MHGRDALQCVSTIIVMDGRYRFVVVFAKVVVIAFAGIPAYAGMTNGKRARMTIVQNWNGHLKASTSYLEPQIN